MSIYSIAFLNNSISNLIDIILLKLFLWKIIVFIKNIKYHKKIQKL